jgi:hypothetical protein
MVSATSTTLPDMMNCEGSAPEGRGRSFAWLFLAAWRMWRTRQCANGAPNAIYRRASASISVHQRASVQVRHERAPSPVRARPLSTAAVRLLRKRRRLQRAEAASSI